MNKNESIQTLSDIAELVPSVYHTMMGLVERIKVGQVVVPFTNGDSVIVYSTHDHNTRVFSIQDGNWVR